MINNVSPTKSWVSRVPARGKSTPNLGSSINSEVRGHSFSFVKQKVNAFFAKSAINHEFRSPDRDTNK